MQQNKNIKKGFSFVELMAIIGIISIMTTVSLVIGNTGKKEKQLDAAARKVESVINLAHSNALTGKDAGSAPGCMYRFWHYAHMSATAFTVRYGIGTLGGPANPPSCQTVDYRLDGGVYFYFLGAVPSLRSISFGIPHGNVISANKELTIVLRIAGTTSERTICVNSRGATRILSNTGALCNFATW